MPTPRSLNFLALAIPASIAPFTASAATSQIETLQQRVEQLERELAETRAALSAARSKAEPEDAREPDIPTHNSAYNPLFTLGPVKVGGAMRVNYVYGDYETSDEGPSRGGDKGNVELDTFRINVTLDTERWIGALEYRWYPQGDAKSYNFLHTLWLGYRFDEHSHIEVGQNRVPFGAGPYGISQSWFFDQHYYVGLSDDPDLGIKYERDGDDWSWNLAWYWRSEPNTAGRSEDSSRYGYDAVRWRETVDEDGRVNFDARRSGYRESNQVNLRLVRHLAAERWQSDLGLSLQYGDLDGSRVRDGDHWAASVHAVNTLDNLTIGWQLSRYSIDVDPDNPWGTDELIPFGAYDFAWPIATQAWVPAISLAYRIDTPALPWLDYLLPYFEYSSIIKSARGQHDSELAVVGAAWANGDWYIYSDLAYSNGNYFVGDLGDDYSTLDGVGDFGVAGNRRWNYRFNLNFGFYY